MEQSRNKPSDTEAQNRMKHRTITAPVIIPQKPDCDYNQGEPPLTPEQVAAFKKSFEQYQLIDYDHQLTDSSSKWYLRTLGTPIKSWISDHPVTYTNVAGKSETIPAGTWWLTTEVTDPEAITLIDNGLLTAYSITVGNRAYCDKFMKQWQTANKADKGDDLILTTELLAAKRKTLIKDIVDPVGFTVSLTGLPCVGSAMFSKDCLSRSIADEDGTAQKTKYGGQENMTEETNTAETKFSIKELLGLKDLFANKADEATEEEEADNTPTKEADEQEKSEYVTPEQLDNRLDEFKGELVTIFDEKLEKVVEKLTVKKEEPKEEDKAEEEEGKTADKHAPTPSSQLDNTDDGYNQNTSNKNNKSTKAKMMKALNRKPNGDYKFPRNY